MTYASSQSTEGPGKPPIQALIGGALAKKSRVNSAYTNAHLLSGIGRRIVGRVGFHGAASPQIGSGNPDSGAIQLYPLQEAEREVANFKWALTPGQAVLVTALVLPSGMTSKYVDEPGSWIGDIPYGDIKVSATFIRSGDVVSKATVLPGIFTSPETYAGEAAGAGAQWKNLKIVYAIITPYAEGDNTPENYLKGSEGVTCELTISYIGGVRAVDVCVCETLAYYVRNLDTNDLGEYFRTMVGEPPGDYPRDYPVSALTVSDPRYGTSLLQWVTHRHQNELGPILAQHATWDESTQPVTSLTVVPSSTSSTSFVALPTGSGAVTWSATKPGHSLSAGGQAQQFKSSSSTRIMRDKNACVPVRIWVRCWRTGTGVATLRFQSQTYSIAKMTLNSSTPAWRSVTGHMRCGLSGEQESVFMMFGKVANVTDSLKVSDVVVEYLNL